MGGPGGTQQPHADGKNSRLLQASQTLEKERMRDAFDTMFLLVDEPCSLLVLMRSDRTRRCVLVPDLFFLNFTACVEAQNGHLDHSLRQQQYVDVGRHYCSRFGTLIRLILEYGRWVFRFHHNHPPFFSYVWPSHSEKKSVPAHTTVLSRDVYVSCHIPVYVLYPATISVPVLLLVRTA